MNSVITRLGPITVKILTWYTKILKWSQHWQLKLSPTKCTAINLYAKASLRAKLILKCFQTHDASILMKAFVTFVRPTLEYPSVVWNPHYKRDIDKVENVQRRFTKKNLS